MNVHKALALSWALLMAALVATCAPQAAAPLPVSPAGAGG